MATPIMTVELSADGNSLFIYRGGLDDNESDFTGAPADTRELHACIGLQREDLAEALDKVMHDVLELQLDAPGCLTLDREAS